MDLTLSEYMIDQWHEQEGNTGAAGKELHEFLGLSWEEYKAVVQDPEALDALVRERNPDRIFP